MTGEWHRFTAPNLVRAAQALGWTCSVCHGPCEDPVALRCDTHVAVACEPCATKIATTQAGRA